MNQIQISRRNAIIKRDAILLGVGILYYIFIKITGLALPCIFNKLTGLLCPGCGITRAVLACARLDFGSAFRYNPYVCIVIPAIIFIICRMDYRYIKDGSFRLTTIENIIVYAAIVGAVVFTILRNIPGN